MQLRLAEAVDLYMGDFARRTKSTESRRTYRRILDKFTAWGDHEYRELDSFTKLDCQRFLDQWQNSSAGTMALHVSILNGFFGFLQREGLVKDSPMRDIHRPKLLPAEDRDVVTVSQEDVEKLFKACEDWQEILCLSVLCFLGPRRKAASNLRWGDVDMEKGIMRFSEKGRKVIWKPIPDQLLDVLQRASDQGVPHDSYDYVIPNRRPASVKGEGRSDKIIWNTVKSIAKRAGVKTHVHALRAAFAVRYLETHDGDIEALRYLMGHTRFETTVIYLRKYEKTTAMERVRDLDWGVKMDTSFAS